MTTLNQVKSIVVGRGKDAASDAGRAVKSVGMTGLMMSAAGAVVAADYTAKAAVITADKFNGVATKFAQFVIARQK